MKDKINNAFLDVCCLVWKVRDIKYNRVCSPIYRGKSAEMYHDTLVSSTIYRVQSSETTVCRTFCWHNMMHLFVSESTDVFLDATWHTGLPPNIEGNQLWSSVCLYLYPQRAVLWNATWHTGLPPYLQRKVSLMQHNALVCSPILVC